MKYINKYKRTFFTIIFIVILIMIDQISKVWATTCLKTSDVLVIPNVLHFHYLENFGAAFGILQEKRIFFCIITPILIAFFIYCFQCFGKNKAYLPIQLILLFMIAGAAGNFLDRLDKGYVIDFIYFVPINFPIFNIADIYVTVSVIVLMILIIFYYKEEDIDEMLFLLGYKKHKSKSS